MYELKNELWVEIEILLRNNKAYVNLDNEKIHQHIRTK